MLHLFLATMDAGHFWSVIAVQMQLVLYIFFALLQSTLQSNIIKFAVDTCAFAYLDAL